MYEKWKSGRSQPKVDKLKILADYFGVSIEYFISQDRTLVLHFQEGSRGKGGENMWMIGGTCVLISAITSAIVTKILATHYFKIVDGYVEDVCSRTKDFVETMKRKLQ